MNKDTRVLTIQDFSSVGQCSITAALPIISAAGIETVALPTAVLSAQTSSFDNYTYIDLQSGIMPAADHLLSVGMEFDIIYTGYLGKSKIVKDVEKICRRYPNAFLVVDPAMAEHGKLYDGIGEEYVSDITRLCQKSSLALPNVSEACMIAGIEYTEIQTEDSLIQIAARLNDIGIKTFAITGIKTAEGMKMLYSQDRKIKTINIDEIQGQFFGSGDVFASAAVGAIANGLNLDAALELAAEFTHRCIEITARDKTHYYGLKFEKAIPYLINKLQQYQR